MAPTDISKRCHSSTPLVASRKFFSLFDSEPAGGWFTEEDRFLSISQNQIQAFQFLKDNTEPTDLIASNSHCSFVTFIAERCEPIAVWASSISQRRFIAGAEYGWINTWGPDKERFARTSGLLDCFLFRPTTSSFSRIREFNFQYFLLDKSNDNLQTLTYGESISLPLRFLPITQL
jgi:hypothetical protein